MARGRWYRDPLTGLSESVDVDFSEAKSYACNLFDVRSIAPHFGITKLSYFQHQVIPRALEIGVHFAELRTTDGKLVGYATCINSAQQGGAMWRAYRNARLSETLTDPTAGSAR
jgi:hypothetical protein